MTMQMPDTFLYHGEKAEAIALSVPFGFLPSRDFGIETISWSTANHRGFWCDYVLNPRLMIHTLNCYSKDAYYPEIKDVQAIPVEIFFNIHQSIAKSRNQTMAYHGPMAYVGIDYITDYTGRIAIGTGIYLDDSGHERYRRVLELEYLNGALLKASNITPMWQQAENLKEGAADDYWWNDPKCSYSDLLNYRFMGIDR